MKRFLVGFLVLALAGCSDDKSDGTPDGGDSDAATNTGGTGGAHTGSGSGGKSGGGSGGNGTGSAGKMNTGGNGGSGRGGSGNSGAGGADEGDDAGKTPDMQTSGTTCKAPTPAQNAGNACPDHDPVALKATLVKDGFDTPVFVTVAPGDASHLIVVERGGAIQRLDPASGETSMFLNVNDVMSGGGDSELGLLGLTFHPDYPKDPRFFVNYTTDPEDLDYVATTHISSFEAPTSDMADADSEQVLLTYNQPQSNHNGGMLAFGTDGCLFIGAGDGGNSNDQGFGHAEGGNAQQLNTALGKILRIDVDNPDKAAPGNLDAAMPQIWDYGIRNAWRFSFDSKTGDLYIGDVGQSAHEEVDVEPKGSGHFNYGWPITEGLDCRSGSCNMNGLTAPVDAYDHVSNHIDCVVGGYVYRGKKIESLAGWYVYGDNGPDGKIRTFVWDGDGRCADTIVLSDRDNIHLDTDITSFGQDAAGELYITTHTSVYRIEAK
jgi:glucose/arabinose dehydrogenase